MTPVYHRIPGVMSGPAGVYAMLWSPAAQMMGDGVEAFVHEGAINTAPSHDLAHLLVAASSSLPWRPSGEQVSVKRAELNAVMTEHLLDKIYRSHVAGEMPASQIVPGLVQHGTWFTQQHFAPFPDTADVAMRNWARGMNSGQLAALSPLFFGMKDAERKDSGFMQRTWDARFTATTPLLGWESLRPHVSETIRTIALR